MTSKILDGAKEAVAIARGEIPAARITVGGHTYVPLAAHERLRDHLSQALRQWRMYAEMHDEADLDHDDTPEAVLYRQLLGGINGE